MTGTRKKNALSATLQAAGCEEFTALAALLAAAAAAENVHGARRRIKRLRSLSRLIRGSLGDETYKKLNAGLRQAADALAGQRRAEALALAAQRLEGRGKAPGFWRPLTEASRLEHVQTCDEAGQLLAARAAVEEAAALFAQAPLASDGEQAVVRAVLKTYAKARKRLRRALASGDAEELHEARKFVIHHLHHLSFTGGGKKRLAQLEELRQLLGDLNDLEELWQLAAQRKAALPAKAAARFAKARKVLLEACATSSRRLFRQSPKALGKQLGLPALSPEEPD